MGASNELAAALLDSVFFDTAVPYDADSSITIALHTAAPGAGGTQSTSEAAYTGYARQTVGRDAAGWTRTGQTVTNDNAIVFPEASSGPETITHWSVGRGSGGSHKIHFSGALDESIVINNNITPEIPAGQISITIGTS